MGVEGGFTTTVVDGVGNPIHDPLTCPDWWVHEYRWGCDCPAKDNEMAEHCEFCSITPIYGDVAAIVATVSDIVRPIIDANLAVTVSVIKCAECGRELLGRDADVIYRAPGSTTDNPDGRTWYRPQYIVKAVCPRHNRKGRIGYQRPMPTGY